MSISGTLSGAAIREKFIRFFAEKHGHKPVPSASLVPANPTVLLTPAGMLPFVPIFLGIEPPTDPPRAVSSQKCARVSGKASDLEYVGRTPRHHTFFEMLGNFSFGDYFKKEAITWGWTFITEELGLPKDRLWVTVFRTDDEAAALWEKEAGVPAHRIIRRDEKDNFWGPPGPTGPCGPCSEIFYDRGGPDTDPSPDKDPAILDEDRYVEVWNLVFMELFKDAEGKTASLDKKNVDTGMGLERITMVIQGKDNTFETDLLYPLVHRAAQLSKIPYKKSAETDVALKIVADHLRCVVFAIGDGVTPSNEGRGYIIRMLLRRAVRYGKKYLGFNEPFLYQLVSTVRDQYGDPYRELRERYDQIVETIKLEEKRFFDTLERGSKMLDELIAEAKTQKNRRISGDEAFKLYDTFGFPFELTQDIAGEEGVQVDEVGFEAAMEAQRQQARSARRGEAIVEDQVYSQLLQKVGATEFVGYDNLGAEATVLALLVDGQPVESVHGTNQPFEAILDRTPFYAESGGQVGDRGSLSHDEGHHGLTVVVNDTRKVGDLIVHHCLFDQGEPLKVGEKVIAEVEPTSRHLSAIHHSATHLLHAALKKVLGDQVSQAGSRVAPEGARFDFTFNRGLKPEELQRVEFLINKWVLENTNRATDLMSIDDARQSGAVAMFGEKYGDQVRVIGFGQHSRELCGGTHVNRLGDIGPVKITSEGAIASGVRRIEFVAGEQAYKSFKVLESELGSIAAMLKSPLAEAPEKVKKLLEELKERDRTIAQLQEKMAVQEVKRLQAQLTPEQPVLVEELSGQSPEALKLIGEKLTQNVKRHVILLASDYQDKAHLLCWVSPDLVEKGLKAGELIKQAAQLCQGGGGGKPNFAQAGGKDPGGIPHALTAVTEQIQNMLSPTKAGS